MPPRFLTGWLQGLAAFIRGVAAALERVSRTPDARLAELAERFPGAPEHWLQYIASHAPHLMEVPASEPAIRRPLETARPSRRAQSQLPETENPAKLSPLKFLRPEAKQSAEKIPRERREQVSAKRAHLRFFPFAHSKNAELQLQPEMRDAEPLVLKAANTNDRPAKKYDRLKLNHPLSPALKPELHLVSGEKAGSLAAQNDFAAETTSTREQREEETAFTRLVRKMRPNIFDAPLADKHDASDLFAANAPEKPAAPGNPLFTDRHKKSPVMSQFAAITDETPHIPPMFETPLRATRNMPAFQGTKTKPPQTRLPERHLDARWPELPPVVETVREAAIEPPRFSRLRREQEEGLWNA